MDNRPLPSSSSEGVISALPHPAPEPPPAPEPRDIPYGHGPIRLSVDARDVLRRIVRARLVIPVAEGSPLTLIYPKWLPGLHSPQAPIELLGGLQITASKQPIMWVRHPVSVNVFEIDVPHGASKIEVAFDFLSPTDASQGRVLMTQDLMMLPWNSVVLYPAGHYARQIEIEASITLPPGWRHATALETERRRDDTIFFSRAPLDLLVDSPLMAGAYLKTFPLNDEGKVKLNVAADRPDLLDVEPGYLKPHRAVVTQCDRLFDCRHFSHYDFLLALSEELSPTGIEHHQSCEAVSLPGYFKDWEASFTRRDTIPHEYLHSWNGKHRRGADSWSPCFEKPIRNSLLWVYEGQTQYWTQVLAARSGLWSVEQTLGALAHTAATYAQRPGSRWRPLIDTTKDPIIAARNPLPWQSWQRSEDYYSEGALIWLDIDTRLRELSGDKISLDDFARAFFGADDGIPVTHTYVFNDVVEALDRLVPYEWRELLEGMLTQTHESAPLGGLARGGYRLVYRDTPNAYAKGMEALANVADFSFSIGLKVTAQGQLADVMWGGPAFDQGLTAGSKIVALNGRVFDLDLLKDFVGATPTGTSLHLTYQHGMHLRDVTLDYDGGLRYPCLERIENTPWRLDHILSPL